MLTKAAEKKYVKQGGVRCPFCDSTQIEGQSVDIDSGGASQRISCLSCEKGWVDCYELTGVIEVER